MLPNPKPRQPTIAQRCLCCSSKRSQISLVRKQSLASETPLIHSYPMSTIVKRTLPPGVIALGIVSLFMDTSSELIHSLLPAFMVSVLGLNILTIGRMGGTAYSSGSLTNVLEGGVRDWLGRRKPLVLLGYGLAALTKPLFPLADGAGTIFAARFLDRVRQGGRGGA